MTTIMLHTAEHRHLLERNFTVRFRCLLDNTSGFLVSSHPSAVLLLIHFNWRERSLVRSPPARCLATGTRAAAR